LNLAYHAANSARKAMAVPEDLASLSFQQLRFRNFDSDQSGVWKQEES